MNRPTLLGLPAAGRDTADSRVRQRGQPDRRPDQPSRTAVPGHLGDHLDRDLGGR